MLARNESIFKWSLYAGATVLLLLLQSFLLQRLSFWGVIPFLYPALAAVLGNYESPVSSTIFGLGLGVVCDLYSLTDAQGNAIWRNSRCSGRPVATEMPFDFKIPMADVQGPVQVELYFGVNEDLGSRFEQDARLILSVPLLAD